MKLVECVPNFSEGRDAGVLDSIIAALLSVPGVYLLDREMDADHHRSVVTLAGEPRAVAEAAVRGAGKAAERIDLTRHRGAHPRLGATDVIPFVPLEGTTLDECVELAQWAGEEIWKRFGIPVYLYEAAARRPQRQRLENVRRGQFEGIAAAIARDPELLPDFGNAALHPTAGASIVGARKFLIAYNINLDTPDVEIARRIARTIRTSGGGLPALKAMGVELAAKHCAQVSMNLTDFEQTGLDAVWQAVEREAARHGARPVESELIGLVPRAALEQAAAGFLKLDVFSSDRVVENRLATVMNGLPVRHEAQLQPFVDALAAPTAAPGGGSAAAAAGAMAAALGAMVAGLVAHRKDSAAHLVRLQQIGGDFARLQANLLRSIDRDSEAFLAVRAAARMPHPTPEDERARLRLLREATLRAAEVPLGVAVLARQVRSLVHELQPLAPATMASDLSTARHLADAAWSGAIANVEINLPGLEPNDPERLRIASELELVKGGS